MQCFPPQFFSSAKAIEASKTITRAWRVMFAKEANESYLNSW